MWSALRKKKKKLITFHSVQLKSRLQQGSQGQGLSITKPTQFKFLLIDSLVD